MVALAKAVAASAKDKTEVDAALVEKLAYTAAGEISPMAAVFGGVVGQEVVKAVSGKFHPILQWFYFDSIESLPEALPLAPEEVAPMVSPSTGTTLSIQMPFLFNAVHFTWTCLPAFLGPHTSV